MVRARNRNPDGRVNSGGARQGTPGNPYANRSDLRTQKPTAAPGQAYGQAADQLAAQKAVPLPAAPPVFANATGGGGGPMQPPAPLPDLYRPTERPGEPVTHGLPTGPGAGPEALPIQQSSRTDPIAVQLRALYSKYAQMSPAAAADLASVLDDVR